jgi:hypothetical protein
MIGSCRSRPLSKDFMMAQTIADLIAATLADGTIGRGDEVLELGATNVLR